MPPTQANNNELQETYRCTFVKGPKKGTVQTKNCLILISMFSDYHKGEQLKAQMELINNTEFMNKYYLLGDSLYAHNLAMKANKEINDFMRKAAHDEGSKWLKDNHGVLSKIPVENFHRWNDFLNIKECQEEIETVKNLFENDSPLQNTYQKAVNQTVNIVFKRFKKSNSSLVEDDKKYILNYILEECGVVAYYIKTNKINSIIYPHAIPAAFASTIQILLADMKIEWLEVKISKNKTNTSMKIQPSREPLKQIPDAAKSNQLKPLSHFSMPRSESVPNLKWAIFDKSSDDNNRIKQKSPIVSRRNEQVKQPHSNIQLFNNNIELEICIIDQKELNKLKYQVIHNSKMTNSQKSKYLRYQLEEIQKLQTDLMNHIIYISMEKPKIEHQASLVNGLESKPANKSRSLSK